jgi:hypothetical protein
MADQWRGICQIDILLVDEWHIVVLSNNIFNLEDLNVHVNEHEIDPQIHNTLN